MSVIKDTSRRPWFCLAAIAVVCCFTHAAAEQDQPGAPFLLVWPSARTSALAGAVTALTDGADGAEWNPACLALQQTTAANLTYGPWVTGLWPGMFHVHAGAFYHMPSLAFGKIPVTLGLTTTYFYVGKEYVIDASGKYLAYPIWSGAVNLLGGVRLQDKLDAGMTLKLIHSSGLPSSVFGWGWFYAFPGRGADYDGAGTTFAADLGLLCQPCHALSVGLAAANLGPNIVYVSPTSGGSGPLPRMLRVGLRYSPVDSRLLRFSVMPEVSKILVGMFYQDSLNPQTFAQQLSYEWREAWKSMGIEVSLADMVVGRVGYFEDVTGARGGIVLSDTSTSWISDEHVSLTDAILRPHPGKRFKSLGLTWGFGIGYHDIIRLDFASDALIYDFRTDDWRVTLGSNNLPGLWRLISRR